MQNINIGDVVTNLFGTYLVLDVLENGKKLRLRPYLEYIKFGKKIFSRLNKDGYIGLAKKL